MDKPIDLVLVSYLNTLPFIKGFENTKNHRFKLSFATPAICSRIFSEGKCDIALMPVGSLLHIENYNLITDYCIGCDGPVRTVGVFSNTEIKNLTEIFVDMDSRTSILLLKILAKEVLKRKITFTEGIEDHLHSISDNQGILAIGDKVFGLEKKYKYFYDLGAAWKQMTNMPFPFAVFVSKNELALEVSHELSNILKSGIDQIDSMDLSAYNEISNIKSYFTSHISYKFDKMKWVALKTFMEYCHGLEE